jgi:hypothetical protein
MSTQPIPTPSSASGGYLTPTIVEDLNDIALAKFLQQVVVGIVGLPGNMVRPRWQVEPPNIPDLGTNWAAIGPGTRKRDAYSARIRSNGNESTTVIRNRTLDILCSFYGPMAETNVEILAMGLEVPQNREVMRASGFNIVGGAGDSIPTPVQIKNLWNYRMDIPFTLRQQQIYTYTVLDVLSAQGTVLIQTDEGIITETFSAAKTTGFGLGPMASKGFGK